MGKALKEKKWNLDIVNLHDFGHKDRKNIDDEPFGGGPGMIVRPDVVEKALNSIISNSNKNFFLVYMSPSGKILNQKFLKKLGDFDEIIILCGRFEGSDYRAIEILGFNEISIGDYVLSGGEIAAMNLIDSCVRLLPNTLGSSKSLDSETFQNNLLHVLTYKSLQKVDNVLAS